MRKLPYALLTATLVAASVRSPASATQPVVRPVPPPAAEALIPCDNEGVPGAYVPRLLRVIVNGAQAREEPVFLQRPCGALLARAPDLKRLRIKTAGKPTVLINGEPYLNLNRYDDLRFELDETSQTLTLEGEPSIFFPTVIDFEPPPTPDPAPSQLGAFLNYGMFASGPIDQGDGTLNANAGLGIFGSQGVLTSDWLAYRQGELQSVYRLGTTYTKDYVERVATLRAGDIRARGGSFGGGAALGGFQYSTNFGTRPRMQIAPGRMMETATRRSASLHLYNDDLWDEERGPRAAFMNNLATVPYGPVELVNRPTYNNGEYELVLRNALGGEETVRQPYFFNQGLLREGLDDFSYEAGLLRQDFTGEDYRDGFAAATYRRGLSNTFTAETHVEAGEPGLAAGGSGIWAVPYWGVMTATAAASTHDQASGAGYYAALGLENHYQRLAYALREDCQNRDFLLPSVRTAPAITVACRTFTSATGTLPSGDTLGLFLTATTQRGLPATRSLRVQYGTVPLPRSQLLLYAGWSNLVQDDYSAGLSFTYSLAALSRSANSPLDKSLLDPRRASLALTAAGSQQGVDTAFARLSNNASLGNGNASVRVGTSLTGTERQTLSLGWAGPRVTASAGVQNFAGLESYTVGASSALVWLDRGLFPSSPLYGSFALVRLGPENGGVRVNNWRSDGEGDAVVSPLLAYYPNVVSVNAADLAFDARLDQLQFEAVPRYRSGLVLRPGIRRVRGAILSVLVQDENGQRVPLPLGAYATLSGSEELFPVGEDGEVYVEGLDRASEVTLHYDLQECRIEAQLPVKPEADSIPELGPFVCESIRP